jgi:epoxyqueuosine reductase QueG
MALSEERWESFSRGSAIRRARRAGFARNVCVAVGNWLAGELGGEVRGRGIEPDEKVGGSARRHGRGR